MLYPSLQFPPVALRGLPFVSVSGLSVRWNLLERFLRSTRVEPFFCRRLFHVSCNISLMCYLVSRCSYHCFLAGLVRAEICRTCQSEFLCFRTLALYLVLLFVALLHFWGQILIGVFRRWRSDEMSAPLIILTSC